MCNVALIVLIKFTFASAFMPILQGNHLEFVAQISQHLSPYLVRQQVIYLRAIFVTLGKNIIQNIDFKKMPQ